jgi:phosphoadenosine phosphosulfate reductase
MNTMDTRLIALESALEGMDLPQMLAYVGKQFPGHVVFSTSFGMEDQVITNAIVASHAPINIFTLDTGRLFNETYSVWASTINKYAIHIKAYSPETHTLNEWLEKVGPNAFYDSLENRKTCCRIRKVEPLKKALAGNKVWVTGIRATQSQNRGEMPILEWDEANSIIKFHPLVSWTEAEVRNYIQSHQVPYNPLHDKGFLSIGCSPCTRAIKPGEDFRAGRWWWEDNSKKECGLHSHGSHKL